MARFNEILVGRYNRFLQKLFSMKGGPPSAQLATEITPNLNLFNGIENRYLESWFRYGAAPGLAAVVGANPVFRFRNPAGSNVIAIVEKLSFPLLANFIGQVELRAVAVDLGGASSLAQARIDPRGNPSPSLILSNQNAGAFSTTTQLFNVTGLANTQVDLILFEHQEIPILPGDALTIVNQSLNSPLQVDLVWRERFLEDSERT